MRKRKLYLSELLNRNTNKDIQIMIKTQFANHYYDLTPAYLNKQVKSWYVKHSTLKETLIVTIDVD